MDLLTSEFNTLPNTLHSLPIRAIVKERPFCQPHLERPSTSLPQPWILCLAYRPNNQSVPVIFAQIPLAHKGSIINQNAKMHISHGECIVQLDMTVAMSSCNHHNCPKINPSQSSSTVSQQTIKKQNHSTDMWRHRTRPWLQGCV